MRLAVEKAFISSSVKLSTLSNISFLRRREKFAAMRDAKKHTAMEDMRLPSAHSNIMPPALHTSLIALFGVSISVVIDDI